MNYLKIIGAVRNPNQHHVLDQVGARTGRQSKDKQNNTLYTTFLATKIYGTPPYAVCVCEGVCTVLLCSMSTDLGVGTLPFCGEFDCKAF
jgi:hypothetical protein